MNNSSYSIRTDYLDGFQYVNHALNFFPHSEGYVNVEGVNPSEYKFFYVYNYTDHLGNIRVSYGYDPDTTTLKTLEENHYYPFGLKHTNYNTYKRKFTKDEPPIDTPPGTLGTDFKIRQIPGGETLAYKYKYNGKEWQDELGLNFYDFGFRNYDPAIGRWMNIDPLAETSRRFSPYVYALDNPVLFLDPDGMEAQTFFKSEFMNKNGGHWSDQYKSKDQENGNKNKRDEQSDLENQASKSSEQSISGENQTKDSSGSSDVGDGQGDPPKTLWEMFKSMFKWEVTSEEEYQDKVSTTKLFFESTNKAIEVGEAYHTAIIELGTLPFGGPGKVQAAKQLALKGFTKHGLERIIERGIKPADILDVLRNGSQTMRVVKNQKQIKIVYKDLTIIIGAEGRNLGRIITAF